MTLELDIASDVQSLAPGQLVSMYILDLSDQDGPVTRFTDNTSSGTNVVFNSHTYQALDIEFLDAEMTTTGAMPRPKLRVGNVARTLMSYVTEYNDIVGAKLTRRRTFAKYLDGYPEANPLNKFPDEDWYVERKVLQTKEMLEFELASKLDLGGVTIPNRRIMKDTCAWRYRRYNTVASGFNYDGVIGCPYTGSGYYDKSGNTTTIDDDVCGKRVSDCQLRFTVSGTLPYGGFPSVAKMRL